MVTFDCATWENMCANRERFMFVQNNLVPDLIWSIFV